jgi:hypothetical protein
MSPHYAPPKPVLTLRVGVTGHRPNKLSDGAAAFLEEKIESMLQRLHRQLARIRHDNDGLYAEKSPCLRVTSALAEGADRLVVSAALRHNYEITAVLPFARDSYVGDFVEQASKDEFRTLLGKASTIIELDGQYEPPEARATGYSSVGMSIVRHADLLVAIWDGGGAHGHGGTAEIVDYAIGNNCPVVWFPAEGKSANYYGELMRLLLPDRSIVVGAEKELVSLLTRLLVPPSDRTVVRPRFMALWGMIGTDNSINRYFSEKRPYWWLYCFFRQFQKLASITRRAAASSGSTGAKETLSPAKSHHAKLRPVDGFIAGIVQEWDDQLGRAIGFHDSKLERLAAHYGWLDQLANHYAALYRSAFRINYTLAAAAVMVAAAASLTNVGSVRVPAAASLTRAGFVLELVFLGFILVSTLWGGAIRGWHRRWIEYRELAEKLRTTRYLRVVASPPVTPQLPPHFTQPNDAVVQTGWLYRAVVRECGLPSIAFTREHFERVREYLIKYEVSDQIDYHHRNSKRLHLFDLYLHVASICTFAIAFLIASLHLLIGGFALSYLSIALPTVGTALFGIRNQGEFVRVSERSKRMEAALKSIRDDLEQSAGEIADRQTLESKVQILAKAMLSETSDWQSLFLARPLELP